MIALPVYLVTETKEKNSGESKRAASKSTSAWLTVVLNEQPHLVIFSAKDKAKTFSESLGDHRAPQVVEFRRAADLSRELKRRSPATPCVLDYEPGRGTQRTVKTDLLLRHLEQLEE